MAALLARALRAGLPLLLVVGTGTGKTSLARRVLREGSRLLADQLALCTETHDGRPQWVAPRQPAQPRQTQVDQCSEAVSMLLAEGTSRCAGATG